VSVLLSAVITMIVVKSPDRVSNLESLETNKFDN